MLEVVMKSHAYKDEEVEEITLGSVKHEVRSAAKDFFWPITRVAEAVRVGGGHLLDSLRGRTKSGQAETR